MPVFLQSPFSENDFFSTAVDRQIPRYTDFYNRQLRSLQSQQWQGEQTVFSALTCAWLLQPAGTFVFLLSLLNLAWCFLCCSVFPARNQCPVWSECRIFLGKLYWESRKILGGIRDSSSMQGFFFFVCMSNCETFLIENHVCIVFWKMGSVWWFSL